ncbi:hypothetical protein [Caulobacter henricii]|uniref:Uncharacterized protein n=1 Tax=Caulobacter henricii TaxID=69395 RepID=A0A0P0NVB2_9CAUL|nr:hypothetical protein [Caulobacter henricii]ALL11959.1 hypothetical protein AQ619_00430 [Caulobacter henricii]
MTSRDRAEQGGMIFYTLPTRRQRAARTRFLALMVIAAMALSAGVIQAFNSRPPPVEILAFAPT